MNKEIIIRSINSAVDFALLHDGKLIELHKEKDNSKFNVGDIFIAKIKKTKKSLMIFGPPKPRHTHNFVFALIHFKAKKRSDSTVEKSQ